MYFKELEHQAVASASQNAVQAIAQIDNPQTCIKKAKAPPPPIMKSVCVLPDSHWRKHYLSVCHGDHAAAELLGEIAFRYQPNKSKPHLKNIRNGRDGKPAFWWGHKLEDLANERGLKYEQVRYALRKLSAWGLIETRSAKTPVKMLQIRLLIAEGAASLNGWPAFGIPQIAICENSQMAICGNSQIKALKGVGSKAVEVVKVFVPATQDTESTSLKSTTQPGKDKPKTKPQSLSLTNSVEGENSKTQTKSTATPDLTPVAAAPSPVVVAQQQTQPKFCHATEKNSAWLLWESLVVQYQPDHALSPQVKGPKLVRDVCNRLDQMADLPGHEPVLRWIVRNWKFWSPEPSVKPGYASSHLDSAVAGYREERDSAAKSLASKKAMAQAIAKADAEIEAAQAAKAAAAPAPEQHESEFVAALLLKAKQKAKAALVPEPVVAHVLDADDFEECDEPPLEVERAPLTQIQLLEAVKAKELARLAAKTKATLFQSKVKA